MPSITKSLISSPLEAGSSLLDSQLPSALTSALEYVSSRLARRRLHLSLIVVRKDIHIPSMPSPQPSPKRPESPTLSITGSPARSIFGNSAFTRSLSKSSSRSSLSDSDSSANDSRNSSPTPSSVSSTPSSSGSVSPALAAQAPNPYGITLMHASTLTEKAEKILRRTIEKAEKKFSIGSGWLPTDSLTTKSTSKLTNDLIHRSLTQNHILFSSEGLTLLSLDHVYTFKCQLHTYSTSLTARDLTLAVDELRRLVLAQQGRRITKGYLMRAYEWLGVSLAALVDVNEGYKTAYGGFNRAGGIEVQDEERRSPPPLAALKTNFAMTEIRSMRFTTEREDESESEISSASTPALSDCSSVHETETLVEVGESWRGRDSGVREDRGPFTRGPVTPNGFEDITPVTKGEWCFLMIGEGWQEGRKAPVHQLVAC